MKSDIIVSMPSTASYRPLEAAKVPRKAKHLWPPKTPISRRMLVVTIVFIMLVIYTVWYAVVNYSDDFRMTNYGSTGKFLHETSSYPPCTVGEGASNGGMGGQAAAHHGYIMAVAAPLMLERLKYQGQSKATGNNTTTATTIQSNTRTSSLRSATRPPPGVSVSARDMQRSSNLLDTKFANESPTTLCGENFNDTRVYMQDKSRHEWGNLSMIYFVTPTYPRREQVPELTRLAYTLLHVPRLHWIVANDQNVCNPYLDTLLNRFGIPYTHLASPMPDRFRKAESKPRGVANRRSALHWLRQHNITSGVLYFGDDDNTYDLKLFSEIRDTKHVSMFPVGLIANYGISGPVVRKGKVIGFLDSWVAGRRWPVDMAGFAVSLSYMAEHPNASMPFKPGYEEDYFLRSIGLTLDLIEPKGNNCTEILVWHTQTKNHERTMVKLNHEYLDDRSNLGALFKALAEMGVSNAEDDEGQKAIISKNGKAKPLGYFLS